MSAPQRTSQHSTSASKSKKPAAANGATGPASSAAAASSSAATTAVIADSLKDQGNRAFGSGEYKRAIDLFTDAIEEIILGQNPSEKTDTSQLHLLYSNRSATHYALRQYQSALEDATQVLALKPSWAKGHYRKGQALEGLLLFHEALAAYEDGLTIDSNDSMLKKSAHDMRVLLNELTTTEAEMKSKIVNPDADRFELMVKWLKTGGSKFPRLYLQYYSEDYRGVHCLSQIPINETILYVPHHMIMTSSVAMESWIGKKMVDAKLELRSKHSYLAAFLLQERAKGADSYWQAYINSLPMVYSNMPIHFDQATLKHLKGSFVLEKITERIHSLRAEYENICDVSTDKDAGDMKSDVNVPEFQQFTHAEFVWARLAVITRIFGLVIRGVKTDGLVAYADMLNHKKPRDASDPADTRWQFDDNLNGFTITALRSIERGEQVYDSYGRKCNSRFFLNYGFALDENEDDNECLLRFTIPADHPSLAVKTRLAGGRNLLATKEFQIPASYRESIERERKTKDMFGYLRFIHATDAELLLINAHEGMVIEQIEPITTRLEIVVLGHILKATRVALDAFDTTLEEDNALLAANKFPNTNVRNCVVQRRGEKQVLRWFENLANKCIPLLGMKWSDLKKLANKFMGPSARDHFVTNVVAILVKRGV